MTLQDHLENLRAKPHHIRKRYAFWSALGVTAIIFAFWVGSLRAVATPAPSAVATAVSKAYTPGKSLIAGVGSFFTDISDMIFGAKKVTYSSVQVLPGKK